MESSPQKDEACLVAEAQAGKPDAWDRLYQTHAERLYRQVIYPCLPDLPEAEDVLRETWLSALREIGRFRYESSVGFFPWLARIARNKAMDRYRRQGREEKNLESYRHALDLLEPSRSPESLLAEEEERDTLKRRIHALLPLLPPRYQDALRLRLFEERPREECALALSVALGTFDVLYHRALQAFRKLWEKAQ